MPNWNYNNMNVKGKPELVKRFIKENFLTQKVYNIKEAYLLDFEVMEPTPIDPETGDIIKDWYDWRLEHWGCKWSPTEEQSMSIYLTYDNEKFGVRVECDEFNEEFIDKMDTDNAKEMNLYMTFFTPWGPPEGMFALWSSKYKEEGLEISIHFYEPGIGFAGEMKFVKGEDDKYFMVDWCKDNEAEYLKYVIENDLEPLDYYIENCYYWIEEMHKDEGKEMIEKIFTAVEKQILEAKLEDGIKLILDIQDKYDKFCEE